MASQIKPFISRLRRYFCAYGGWGAILRSPLFLLATLLTGLGYGSWFDGDRWSDLSQSLIPNLLGFSLGTYAILFSLMTGRVNRRSIGTPYRRAKGTPLRLCGSVDAGRVFRAAGGVGRA